MCQIKPIKQSWRSPGSKQQGSQDGTEPASATARRRGRYRPKVTGVVTPSAQVELQAAPGGPAVPAARAAPGTQNWALIASMLFTGTILAALVISSLDLQVNLSIVTGAFTVRFISLFVEAAPFLLLGSLVAGLD